MKINKLLILINSIVILFLSGCASQPVIVTKTVDIPVWISPTITMPDRPKLISDGIGSDGEIAKKLEVDLVNMSNYDTQLENLLLTIKNYKPNSGQK